MGGLIHYGHNGPSFKSTKLLPNSMAFRGMQGMQERAAENGSESFRQFELFAWLPYLKWVPVEQ